MTIARATFACALLCLPAAARAEERGATVTTIPAESGVAAEARTVIDAPAERVAHLAGDPAAFAELLPAAAVRLRRSEDGAQVVEVERREPWPIGVVRWTESVRRRSGEGGAFIVERQAVDDGYFRRLEATFWVTPLGPERCSVTYRVSMDLRRWAPLWMVRRGNSAGMLGTLSRLRHMSERPLAATAQVP